MDGKFQRKERMTTNGMNFSLNGNLSVQLKQELHHIFIIG